MHIIVGEEISAREGHVVGLFLQEWIPPGMDAARTVDAIHRQGGIAIAAHPYTNLMRWNNLVGVGNLIRSLPFDAVETRNSNFTEFRANRRAAAQPRDESGGRLVRRTLPRVGRPLLHGVSRRDRRRPPAGHRGAHHRRRGLLLRPPHPRALRRTAAAGWASRSFPTAGTSGASPPTMRWPSRSTRAGIWRPPWSRRSAFSTTTPWWS